MGTRTVYKINYSFSKPEPITKLEYEKIDKTFPSYPIGDNVFELVFKKYWFNIIFAIIFPPSIIFSVEFIEYYQVIKKKNRILFEYYSVIYNSNDYNDYLEKYNLIK